MKASLPEKNFFDSFYIWFNKEKREEYYSTTMYTYKTETKTDHENRLMTISYNKKAKIEKGEDGLKYPGNMYFPYVEKFGMFLLRFLNAKLENFETAYETFFFAYGFEILKEIDENYTFELKGKYAKHEEYINEVTKIYNDLQYQIQNIQDEMREFVDYVYNINDKEELREYTHTEGFVVYL